MESVDTILRQGVSVERQHVAPPWCHAFDDACVERRLAWRSDILSLHAHLRTFLYRSAGRLPKTRNWLKQKASAKPDTQTLRLR
ncbi:hypothetical protein VPJ68_27455 [Parabacteroides distasonis]